MSEKQRTQRDRYIDALREIEDGLAKTRTHLTEGADLLQIISQLHNVAERLERVYGSMEELSHRALKAVLAASPPTDSLGREHPVGR